MPVTVPLPDFQPDLTAGALEICDNVYPKADGYGPVMGAVEASDALPANFAGGASFVDYSGVINLIAGTTNGIELFGGGSWSALITGLSVTHWRFAQFGNYGIAVSGGAGAKVIDLDAGTAGALSGAPDGQFVAVVGDYVVIANVGADEKGYVYNSGFNDHTKWTPGDAGAGIQPMLTGGEVMGLSGGEYGIILQRTRLVRMSRTGETDTPFEYDEITPNVGCASKASVAQYGRSTWFLSDQGFMGLLDGQELRPIGHDKIDDWFKKRTTQEDYERLWTAIDPANKLVIWGLPGNPGLLLKYNFERDRWATSTIAFDGMLFGLAVPTSLEDLSVDYPDLDVMPYSLDDERFRGGLKLFLIKDRKLQTLSGPALEATFGLNFAEYAQGQVSRFRSVRPITDAIAGLSVTLDCRQRLGDAENARNFSTLRTSGIMPVRHRGKYAKVTIKIASGSSWTYTKGIELEMEAAGGR